VEEMLLKGEERTDNKQRANAPLNGFWTKVFVAKDRDKVLPICFLVVELIFVQEIDVLNILFGFRIGIFFKGWDTLANY
jgi:hypothetical protein